MQYKFVVASTVTATANHETGTSAMISCDVDLIADQDIQKDWRQENGVVNAAGLKVQTQGLIQGLVANIHFGHQQGLWDSAEQYRYILEHLEKGFAYSGGKSRIGKK